MKIRRVAPLLLMLSAFFAVAALMACGSSSEPSEVPAPEPTATVAQAATTEVPETGPTTAAVESESAEEEPLEIVLAASDFAVGPNRFPFAILDRENRPIRASEANVRFVSLDPEREEIRMDEVARFRKWPVGDAGIFTVNVTFAFEGDWGVLAGVKLPDGTMEIAQGRIIVSAESLSPGIGKAVPRSPNKTAADVSDLAELTTSINPDPDLYQMTIPEAVDSGIPTVITFASPAFCQTATCGPQVQVLTVIKKRHDSEANFIHVEIYDNPQEMQGDISLGRLHPVVEEWNLATEPFTFVLGKDGLVAARLEGFVGDEELEEALQDVLAP